MDKLDPNGEMQALLDAEADNLFFHAPRTKLDDDQFLAEDIDGVTDSAAGNGNLNYLLLQAAMNSDGANRDGDVLASMPDGGWQPQAASRGGHVPSHGNDLGGTAGAMPARTADVPKNEAALSLEGQSISDGPVSIVSEGGDIANTMSSESVRNSYSSTSRNAGSSSSRTSADTTTTENNTYNNNSTTNTNNGGDNTNNNGGNNVSGGVNTNNEYYSYYEQNTYNTETNTYNSVVNNNVTNTTHVVNEGDAVTNNTVTITDIDNVVNNSGNTITIINNDHHDHDHDHGPGIDLPDITVVLPDIDAGDIITTVTTQIDTLLDQVQEVVCDTVSILEPVLQTVETVVSETTNVVVNVVAGVEDVVETVVAQLPSVPDLGALLPSIGGDAAPDTDIGLGALRLPIAQTLDPVENLIGDVDAALGVSVDLFQTAGIDNASGDTDLVLLNDANILGQDLAGVTQSVNLDVVESLVSDIDIDLTGAANLLGSVADPLLDNHAGGGASGLPVVDDVLSSLGSGVAELAGTLLGGEASASSDTDIAITDNIGLGGSSLLEGGVNLVLDPVEDVIGDVDLALDINLGLLNPSASSEPDTGDLDVLVDLGLVDQPLANALAQAIVDPLEEIVGDIDISLTLAADLLSVQAPSAVDQSDGGTGQDTILSQIGDELSGFVENVVLQHGAQDQGGGTLLGALADASWTDGNSGGDVNGAANVFVDAIGNAIPDPVHIVSNIFESLGSGHSEHHGGLSSLFG